MWVRMDIVINLIINGLATGMLLFLLAAGLTLIFGLMHVLNFAHGGLFVWGAYAGVWLYLWTGSFAAGLLGACSAGLLLGFVMERLIIRPVYGDPTRQILITLGVMLVLSELVKVFWGSNQISVPPLDFLEGSWRIGEIVLIKYRVFVITAGVLIFALLQGLLKKTRVGLIIRAGAIHREMVESLGINVKRYFLLVFMLGAALAALAGVLFAPYSGAIYAEMGMEYAILAFIVVVVGGLGSVSGSALAALMVGLASAFMNYFLPDAALAVNMLLMAAVLLFKPSGLFGARG
ncbi:amino acid/amide ABC transporter membrane protein 1, HAAT family [Planifilum fulgidum]|uniref:Amino acid/amide ABC transporter membrane protein 1, HAAT family n=2 Tax=Planifilum fulgidum TaxID=201973 RepID=A0A1I2NC02_9BACL|nr:amino acid/amide ABC transporter membrane protein 1, HAAT family [Planifilum fulgidum]